MTKTSAVPWVVKEGAIGVSVRAANGEVIFHESDKRLPGVMGDAHLISAAPELLEALEALYAVQNGPPLVEDRSEWLRAMELADEAIRKAKRE